MASESTAGTGSMEMDRSGLSESLVGSMMISSMLVVVVGDDGAAFGLSVGEARSSTGWQSCAHGPRRL